MTRPRTLLPILLATAQSVFFTLGAASQYRNADDIENAELQWSSPRRLTAIDGYYSPKWSPSGESIAFIGRHGTFSYDVTTAALRKIANIQAGFAYCWTPDGTALVYRSTVNGQFFMNRLSIFGGDLQVIDEGSDLKLPQTAHGQLRYRSHPAQRISQTQYKDRPRDAIFAWQENDQIFIDTGAGSSDLTDKPRGRYFLPTVSPDGGRVLYYELSRGLFVTDLRTGITQSLGVLSDASWSPRAEEIACERVAYDDDDVPIASDLLICSAGSGRCNSVQTPGLRPMRPSWSPDGESIAFDSDGALYIVKKSTRRSR